MNALDMLAEILDAGFLVEFERIEDGTTYVFLQRTDEPGVDGVYVEKDFNAPGELDAIEAAHNWFLRQKGANS